MRSRKIKRIGIFGGTFNPVHNGHLILAEWCAEKLLLDKIIFIPTYIPPHKKIWRNNALHRYKMLTLACEGNPKFSVSKIELNRKSISYSVHTLKRLKLRYGKDAKLFFLIGADSYNDLSSWKEIESALKLATFVAVSRAGTTSKKGRYGINFIDMPDVGISSSLIRRRLKASESIKYLVPENVRNFIEEYGVYG